MPCLSWMPTFAVGCFGVSGTISAARWRRCRPSGALRPASDGPGWECEDDTELRALRERGGPAILFSGHLATWEIGLPVAASLGLAVSWFYRAASNPAADAAIQDMRCEAIGAEVPMFAKGSAGAREALAHLRRGRRAGRTH